MFYNSNKERPLSSKLMNIYTLALKEDIEPNGDLSTKYFESKELKAQIIAKEAGIFACGYLIEAILEAYKKLSGSDFNYVLNLKFKDGGRFVRKDVLCEIVAPSEVLLICERTILNFLQRTCAIATKASHLVEKIESFDCEVLDTRKTSPGMRQLEKDAFKIGGGTNHRLNLSDKAMLKENHLKLLGISVIDGIKKLKSQNLPIVVEINSDNLSLLEAVCKENIEQIMLDNFPATDLSPIVEKIRGFNPAIKIEASGGINELNIEKYARSGVDYVSSAQASRAQNLDLSMIVS